MDDYQEHFLDNDYEDYSPTTETIITTVTRKTMEIFTKRMILMRVIRNTNQGGKTGS